MTKRHSKEAKRQDKSDLLISRTAQILGISQDDARKRLTVPLRQSVRINSLKGNAGETLEEMRAVGWEGEAVAWCPNGFTIAMGFEELRDSNLTHEGKVYIQNSSSWLPVVLLSPQPNETILDVCAAPGGKTSHIAATMQNRGRLVANDNSRPRLMKLQHNMQRLGATSEYTLYDATNLSKALAGEQFDKILLDAPCSGEGLINLNNPKTIDTWSVAHIKRLITLQKRLLSEAWLLLKPGGTLIYSTCTMAPGENEGVISWFLTRHDDADVVPATLKIDNWPRVTEWNDRAYDKRVTGAIRIAPGDGNEAFFACALTKLR